MGMSYASDVLLSLVPIGIGTAVFYILTVVRMDTLLMCDAEGIALSKSDLSQYFTLVDYVTPVVVMATSLVAITILNIVNRTIWRKLTYVSAICGAVFSLQITGYCPSGQYASVFPAANSSNLVPTLLYIFLAILGYFTDGMVG